ncbi:MAG: hypothetical protein AB1753_09140 [Thermoproteota archaeon]
MHTKNEEEVRDIELENILGNLLIAEYQVDKLRSRLSERIKGYRGMKGKSSSVYTFKNSDRLVRVRVEVDEMPL